MTGRERFLSVMDYKPADRVPNHELGVWPQTVDRWEEEGLNVRDLHWDWFVGEEYFGMDAQEFIPVNFGMIPPFDVEILEHTDEYEVVRHANGVVTRAMRKGTVRGGRPCMDQYLAWPVTDLKSFRELKKRYDPTLQSRYPAQWREIALPRWKTRDHVLVLGRNCSTLGFYWRAREWMGTENLSYAWYMQPGLTHEMMEFIADYTIEVSRPILEETDVDYVALNEDMAMKTGPLLSPKLYREYILPHLKRLVEFLKANGVRYIMVDTDGNSEPLIPLLMEAGVDGVWPLERAAAAMDPLELRKKYGKDLLLWGGVDKRELTKDRKAIDAHLRALAPLVEEGGFIPTVDHTVPPDVSLGNFRHYMDRKQALLRGAFK